MTSRRERDVAELLTVAFEEDFGPEAADMARRFARGLFSADAKRRVFILGPERDAAGRLVVRSMTKRDELLEALAPYLAD